MARTKAAGIERETKGERTRRRIMDEARAMIDEVGIEAISQEAVARRVGITQSALRHHFPTREALFDAIFDHVFSGFYRSAEAVLLEPGHDPRQRLLKLCDLHLGYVTSESDRVALGSFAHYLYNPSCWRGRALGTTGSPATMPRCSARSARSSTKPPATAARWRS